jgi:hypothetical protein
LIVIAQQAAISTLVEEVRETNRFLKALVAQKAPDSVAVDDSSAESPVREESPRNSDELSVWMSVDNKKREHRLKLRRLVQQYTEESASEEVAVDFRDHFLSHLGHRHEDDSLARNKHIARQTPRKYSRVSIREGETLLRIHRDDLGSMAEML